MENGVLFKKLYRGFAGNPVFLATLILTVVMILTVPSFASVQNIRTLAQQFAFTGIAATGLAFVLIGGGNDLSIGSNISLSSVVAALVMTRLYGATDASVVPGILAALATGALIGLFNGFCVAKIGMNAFILTLIMQMLCDGISLIATDAVSIGGLPKAYTALGTGVVAGIPLPILVMLGFFILGQFVLSKTAYGRRLFAVGANRQAARLVGVPIVRIQILAFVISGVCAACAGVILSARLGAATPNAGSNSMLEIMSAAISAATACSAARAAWWARLRRHPAEPDLQRPQSSGGLLLCHHDRQRQHHPTSRRVRLLQSEGQLPEDAEVLTSSDNSTRKRG